MFGSQALEVGIGLILVFLMVSLILTAVRETIESWLRTRSRDLEQAVAELLDDADGTGLRGELYRHPLVNSLFCGAVQPTTFSNGSVVARASRNLPSYIPRETFALALEDLLSQGNEKMTARVGTAYAALIRVSGGDPARVRKGLEQWYDASMDRAAGWYRRRTQKLLFFLGVGVAVVLNINAVAIAQYLAVNPLAQQQVVAIAGRLQNDPAARAALARPAPVAPAAPAAGQPDATGADNAAAAAEAGGNAAAGNGATENESASDAATNETAAAGNAQAAASQSQAGGAPAAAVDVPIDIARQLQGELSSVGLPILWDAVQRDRLKQQFSADKGWWAWLAALLMLVAGYLIVGFAATLGAPFWFDVLGKFMVVRSTVKPTEKSPDEASKDGGTAGAPQPGAAAGGLESDAPPPRGPGYTSPMPDRALSAPDPVEFG